MFTKNLIAPAAIALALAWSHAASAQALVDGLVTKVDSSLGKITLRHGPIKKFDMDDGMTMVFRAADPAMLNAVKAGDKVKFDSEKINGQFTITTIEKVK